MTGDKIGYRVQLYTIIFHVVCRISSYGAVPYIQFCPLSNLQNTAQIRPDLSKGSSDQVNMSEHANTDLELSARLTTWYYLLIHNVFAVKVAFTNIYCHEPLNIGCF
jgi:hypothetical protein